MKGHENAEERLKELKNETRNITRLLSKLRHMHPSKWIKRVRQKLQTLLDSPGTLSANVQWECLLAKLKDALDAVSAAMKISRSEKLTHVHGYIASVLSRFSGGTIDQKNNTL